MRVFVAGPRAVGSLNKNVTDVLARIIEKKLTVLLGDAAGVDRLVQKYFSDANYPDVFVYASNGKPRNNLGEWPICKVEVPDNVRGFNFYAQKDIKMAKDADNGFMIWNGKSKGTLNNIINLVNQNKKVVIYLIPLKRIICIDKLESVKKMVDFLGPVACSLYEELCPQNTSGNVYEDSFEQMSLSDIFG